MGTAIQSRGAGAPLEDWLSQAAGQLRQAVAAPKCWKCGCLRHALEAIERATPEPDRGRLLATAMTEARARLVPQRYDCLGCEVCYPAAALDALGRSGLAGIEAEVCPTEAVEARGGWPPLPGSYHVLRYRAPVAVCTLNDDALAERIATDHPPEVAIVGTLHTENLGIERLVTNVLANPTVRFVIVCGPDSRQRIGHLPGQSLVALAREGIDADRRIVGARGKRPVLRNLESGAVDHFRRTVEVLDLVGVTELEPIAAALKECVERDPGPAEAFAASGTIKPITGSLPERMTSDPNGYFVVYVDRARRLLSLEHYDNNGMLTTIIEAPTAAAVYMPAVDRGLLSRLDHAAYLGRELARAEHALSSGDDYVQEAAPEIGTCGCSATGAACHR